MLAIHRGRLQGGLDVTQPYPFVQSVLRPLRCRGTAGREKSSEVPFGVRMTR